MDESLWLLSEQGSLCRVMIEPILEKLVRAVTLAACALHEHTGQDKIEFEWLKSHSGLATKQGLCEMEKSIMGTLKEYSELIDAKFNELSTSVDEIVQSQIGITADVASLKDIITKLQNNTGPISAEDQVLLDQGVAKVTELASRTSAVSAALKELDAATDTTASPPDP